MIFDVIIEFLFEILGFLVANVVGIFPPVPEFSSLQVALSDLAFVLSIMFQHVSYFVPVGLVLVLITFNIALYSFNFFYAVFLKVKSFIPVIS